VPLFAKCHQGLGAKKKNGRIRKQMMDTQKGKLGRVDRDGRERRKKMSEWPTILIKKFDNESESREKERGGRTTHNNRRHEWAIKYGG